MINKNLKLLILTGPSGSGKTTLSDNLITMYPTLFKQIKTTTTREIRKDSLNDNEQYNFITIDEFKNKINNFEFIEYEEVYNNCFYGTEINTFLNITDYSKIYILCVDVFGALNLKKTLRKYIKDYSLITFFCDPIYFETVYNRLYNRGYDIMLNDRLDKYEREIKYKNNFDCIINTNEPIINSINNIINIIPNIYNKNLINYLLENDFEQHKNNYILEHNNFIISILLEINLIEITLSEFTYNDYEDILNLKYNLDIKEINIYNIINALIEKVNK
jgi:guanylate kinase